MQLPNGTNLPGDAVVVPETGVVIIAPGSNTSNITVPGDSYWWGENSTGIPSSVSNTTDQTPYLPVSAPTDACRQSLGPIAHLYANGTLPAGGKPIKLNGALRGVGSLASCSVSTLSLCDWLCCSHSCTRLYQ